MPQLTSRVVLGEGNLDEIIAILKLRYSVCRVNGTKLSVKIATEREEEEGEEKSVYIMEGQK